MGKVCNFQGERPLRELGLKRHNPLAAHQPASMCYLGWGFHVLLFQHSGERSGSFLPCTKLLLHLVDLTLTHTHTHRVDVLGC